MIHFEANPFCTARIRPGQLPYRFSPADRETDPQRLAELIARWREEGGVVQIVGPHGCGKSTLASALASSMVASHVESPTAARTIIFRRTKDGANFFSLRRWLQPYQITRGVLAASEDVDGLTMRQASPRSWITIVDGLEVLPRWLRGIVLRYFCVRANDCLVTAHRPLSGITVLYQVEPDIQMFASLARSLAGSRFKISDDQIQTAFLKANGNCREGLMNLYDLVEQRL